MTLILFICGVVGLNLGPKRTKFSYNFFLFHWNLKSLLAYDFSKLSIIELYKTHHNFDTICLSGTYLDFFYAIDDPLLNFKDFTLIRADNPHNWKRGGASICFKEHWAVRPARTKSSYSFALFHWNLKSLLSYNFSKLSLIEPYNTHHNFDTICLSGTCSYFLYAIDDPLLNFKDFTLIRVDNPHNWKRGGVSICFKEHCAVRLVSSLNLNECLGLKSNIHNKKGYVISLSQSPSQNKDFFDQFILNFEQHISDRMIQNRLSTLVICNFKVR